MDRWIHDTSSCNMAAFRFASSSILVSARNPNNGSCRNLAYITRKSARQGHKEMRRSEQNGQYNRNDEMNGFCLDERRTMTNDVKNNNVYQGKRQNNVVRHRTQGWTNKQAGSQPENKGFNTFSHTTSINRRSGWKW